MKFSTEDTSSSLMSFQRFTIGIQPRHCFNLSYDTGSSTSIINVYNYPCLVRVISVAAWRHAPSTLASWTANRIKPLEDIPQFSLTYAQIHRTVHGDVQGMDVVCKFPSAIGKCNVSYITNVHHHIKHVFNGSSGFFSRNNNSRWVCIIYQKPRNHFRLIKLFHLKLNFRN